MTIDPPIGIIDMPEEVLLNIFQQDLDIPDLKALRKVNKLFYKIASDDLVWEVIAWKINYHCKFSNDIKIINWVKWHVQLLYRSSLSLNGIIYQSSILKNWTQKNIRCDRDLNIKNILYLKKQRTIERMWKPHNCSQEYQRYITSQDRTKGSRRSITPVPVVGRNF